MLHDERTGIRKHCAIRSHDEMKCYLRFGSCPAMDRFRVGFLHTGRRGLEMTDEELASNPFSCQHVDRKQGELPAGLIERIYGLSAEGVVEQIGTIITGFGVSAAEVEGTSHQRIPFAEEFCSTFDYRDYSCTPRDAGEFLPHVDTLREIIH